RGVLGGIGVADRGSRAVGDPHIGDGLGESPAFLGPGHGIGNRTDGSYRIWVRGFGRGDLAGDNGVAGGRERTANRGINEAAAAVPQGMEFTPRAGEVETVAAGVTVRMGGGDTCGAMKGLFNITNEVDQVTQGHGLVDKRLSRVL